MYTQSFAVYMKDILYTDNEACNRMLIVLEERLTNLEAVLVQLVHHINPGEEE